MLKIGIIGLGNIASTHASAIQDLPNAELCSAFSRSEENRRLFSAEFDVPVYSTFKDFLTRSNVDAVTICTPTGTHLDIGAKAAEAGMHLIIEKPIETTVERGKELIKICRQNGVKLAVIYQNRFTDAVIGMKNAIQNGKIGKPVMVRASVKWFRDQQYYAGSGWRGTFKMDGGGAVINQSIHTIDLLYWLLGEVNSISALKGTFTHPGIEAEDNAVAILEFKRGTLGVFEASTSVIPAQPRFIEVNGELGTAILVGDEFKLLLKNDDLKDSDDHKPKSTGAESPLAGMSSNHHQKQFRQIVNAILDGSEPTVSGVESLYSLAMVQAIYRSADEKRPIKLSEILK